MAVALLALLVTASAFRDLIHTGISHVVQDYVQAVKASTWEGIKILIGGGALVFTIVISILVSLCLPFTKRNFDLLLPMIIGMHLLIVSTSNFLLYDERKDLVSALIAGAGMIYFMLFCIAYRMRYVTAFTSIHQATPRQALVAALSVSILVGLFSVGLDWHWAHSYAVALGYALTVGSIANAFSNRGI